MHTTGPLIEATPRNAYFTASPQRITYTPAANNTASRPLTTTIAESNGTGILSSSASSTIAITPVNDAPTINLAAVLSRGTTNTPFEMTYDTLKTAFHVADVETATPSIVIQAVNSGSLQK